MSDPFPSKYPPEPQAPVMFKIWRAEGGWSCWVPEGTPPEMREIIRLATERMRRADQGT